MARTNPINLRLDDEELAALRAAAEEAGIPVSTWIRETAVERALHGDPQPEPVQRMNPMLLLYAGVALAEAQRQQRPRWWRFWQRWQPGQRQQRQPELATAVPQIAEGAVVDAVYTG